MLFIKHLYKTLNFLKCSKCSREVKESAYLTMVQPQLGYEPAVWDPEHVTNVQESATLCNLVGFSWL